MRKQKNRANKRKKQKDKETKKAHKKNRNGGIFKLDPNITSGPKARCTRCPNAKHSWGNYFLNPWNPKNKLKDPNFNQN